MRTARSPQPPHISTGGVGGPQVNLLEQVSSLGYQISPAERMRGKGRGPRIKSLEIALRLAEVVARARNLQRRDVALYMRIPSLCGQTDTTENITFPQLC